MKENRLEGVLHRNRRHLVIDVALAAFFVAALLVSGMAFGAELPKLSMAARPAAAQQASEIAAGADTAPHLARR